MHNHFDKNLNLKKWILEKRPKVIVECGSGNGELTKQLSSLLDIYDFKLFVISDRPVNDVDKRVIFKTGLSFNVLKEFQDESIDLCVIDTDHNYWTLMKEFEAVFNKMSEGGLIALHDVETFYHDTGMALKYSNGEPYPKEEIQKFSPYGSLGDAMIDFLHLKKMNYKLLHFTNQSNGAALIEKKSQSHYSIVVPGSNPLYAESVVEEVANAG